MWTLLITCFTSIIVSWFLVCVFLSRQRATGSIKTDWLRSLITGWVFSLWAPVVFLVKTMDATYSSVGIYWMAGWKIGCKSVAKAQIQPEKKQNECLDDSRFCTLTHTHLHLSSSLSTWHHACAKDCTFAKKPTFKAAFLAQTSSADYRVLMCREIIESACTWGPRQGFKAELARFPRQSDGSGGGVGEKQAAWKGCWLRRGTSS